MGTNNPEYRRAYYEKHKAKAKKQAKRYYEMHRDDPAFREQRTEYMRQYREDPEVRKRDTERTKAYLARVRDTPEFKAKKRNWANNAYRRLTAQNKATIGEEFFGPGCRKCGEQSRACLEAHHIDPTEKEHSVSYLWRLANVDRLREEIAKCVCLCSNCHRKLHAKEITL